MKIKIVLLCIVFGLSAANFSAQSRRPVNAPETGKANRRPASPAPTPTPDAAKSAVETVTPSEQNASDAAAADDGEVIRVDTSLVTIPVKVSDRKNRFIGGLTKENFKVFEESVEQEIALFSNEQQPFTVALVLDMSYSTTFKIAEIQSAAIAFINQLRENDKVMVVSFDEEVHILTEPTSDRQRIYGAIKSTKISTGTSLYEAVDLVMNEKLRKIDGRKAIVLFTDGVDTTSRKAHDLSNLSDALELDALVYPVQYDTFADVQAMKNKPVTAPTGIPNPIPSQNKSPFPFPIPMGGVGTPSAQGTTPEDYRKAGEYLSDMALRTGGRVYPATSTANLSQAFSNIASELREFYSLGYYPSKEAEPGKKRRVKVKVNQENVAVRARDSYVVSKN